MSRGETPSAFNPFTRLESEAPDLSMISFLPFSSSTLILVCGVTTVWP